MAMEEASELPEEPTAPRRKTPLMLLAMGAAGLGGLLIGGIKSAGQEELRPTVEVTRAASFEGSSMVRALEEQRRAAQELERQQTVSTNATPSVAAAEGQVVHPAGTTGGATYVAPTDSVPRYAFAGGPSKCEELPSLEERLKCLDMQFVSETRESALKELGDALTSDDNLFGLDAPRARDSAGVPPVPAPVSVQSASSARQAQWGDVLEGAGGYGLEGRRGGPGGMASPTRDVNIEFHRTGGAEARPERRVSGLQKPETRYWLRAGSVLPCAFISGVTSQLPGQVEAQVTQNVYDSIDHRHLLIPAGSLLVGRPNSEVRPGQNRVQFAWTELHLPDGEFRELGGMAGADGAGLAGVGGKVNRHWGQKLGLALMTSTINVSFHLASPQPGIGTMQDSVSRGVGEGVVQTATEGLRRMMQVPDEITISPGQTCSVKVEQSLSFPRPYDDGKRWRR